MSVCSSHVYPDLVHVSRSLVLAHRRPHCAPDLQPQGVSAMIRFLCPRCDTSLTASHRKGGAVCSCPKCRQPLQVPSAPERMDAETGSGVDVLGKDGRLKAAMALRWTVWAACIAWVGV